MRKLAFLFLLSFCVKSSFAAIWDYRWEGVTHDDSTQVSGSFRYDDAAEIVWTHDDGEQIQGNACHGISLLIGQDSYARSGQWDAHKQPDGKIYFAEATFDSEDGSRLTWSEDSWSVGFWGDDGYGGRVINFYKTGWVPQVDLFADAAPTPEPASWALMASALLAFAGIRGYRRKYRDSR